MPTRQTRWIIAHTLVSLGFGCLMLFLVGKLLAITGTITSLQDLASPEYAPIALAALALGNPVFRLLRYRNLLAVVFFAALSLLDPRLASFSSAIFCVLVAARKLLHRWEQRSHERTILRMPFGQTPIAATAKRTTPKCTRGFRAGLAAGLAGAPLPSSKRPQTDPATDRFVPCESTQVPSQTTAQDGPSIITPSFNPATGLPMLGPLFDIMGNPLYFSNSDIQSIDNGLDDDAFHTSIFDKIDSPYGDYSWDI